MTPADIVVDGPVSTAKIDAAIASLTGRRLRGDSRFGRPTVDQLRGSTWR